MASACPLGHTRRLPPSKVHHARFRRPVEGIAHRPQRTAACTRRRKRWVFIAIGARPARGDRSAHGSRWAATRRPKCETAQVTTVGGANGSSAATVLDATGYVVARRMATVSAKITGKVREVHDRGRQHVEAGQVMATLDPIDADAERTLTPRRSARRKARSAACRRSCKRSRSQRRAPQRAGEAAAGRRRRSSTRPSPSAMRCARS